jgi:hypothetical protein
LLPAVPVGLPAALGGADGVFAVAALVGAGAAGACAYTVVAASSSVLKIIELARFILIASDSRNF